MYAKQKLAVYLNLSVSSEKVSVKKLLLLVLSRDFTPSVSFVDN
jgi:hypothetical protein